MYSKADIHLHTHHSDGTASVAQVLAHVAAHTDLKVIAITDHDTMTGAHEARDLAPEYGVEVVMGEEISTAEGHLLALFIEERIAPGRPAGDTIREVHAQGGLCIAAHPYDWSTPSLGRRIATLDIDAIEVFNASLAWPRSRANLMAQHMALALGCAAVGGSDSHSLTTLGRGFTTFQGTTAADLRQSLVAGNVGWNGASWTALDYLEIIRLYVRQRHILGTLKVTMSGGAVPLR